MVFVIRAAISNLVLLHVTSMYIYVWGALGGATITYLGLFFFISFVFLGEAGPYYIGMLQKFVKIFLVYFGLVTLVS